MLQTSTSRRRGFTIVELLIVIVVIGILAAITIVAFNGVQQRARNAQVIAGVNTYYKAILSYTNVYNTYPESGNGCLGASYPGDQCWSGTSGNRSINAALDANLAEFVKVKPVLATSLLPIGIGNNMRAGAVYDFATKRIVYYLQGINQDCSIGGSFGGNEGGVVTQCVIAI